MKKKKRILVVDDDLNIRNILLARLGERDGHEVLLAENGEKALGVVKAEQIDLIILDWMMPGISGLETLEALKKDNNSSGIPVYMLTGKKVMNDIERAFSSGADGYFTKPIKATELSKRIMIALKNIEHEG
jgi:DNA-binding response OmpR family regulator